MKSDDQLTSSLLKTDVASIDPAVEARVKLLCEVAYQLGLKTEMGMPFLTASLENVQLFDKRQQDYGSGNFSQHGELGVVIRLSDKLARLTNLLKKGGTAAVNDEALEDTWKDIGNYGLIGFLLRTGQWK